MIKIIKKQFAFLLILIVIFIVSNTVVFAKNYISSIFIVLNDGAPITSEQTIRLSLWSDGRLDSGDIASGVINTGANNYEAYQTETTRTPDSVGRLSIAFGALTDFPQVTHSNQFLMIEYKNSGDPVTSYIIYNDIYINNSSLDRFPLIESGPDIYESLYTNNETTADIFIIDGDDSATGTAGIQIGSSNESFLWNISNDQFELSDNLSLGLNELKDIVIDKQVTAPATPASGQIYYNTTTNKIYVWNGSSWDKASDDLDSVYFNDADKKMAVNHANGLEFESSTAGDVMIDLQSTGNFVVQNAGIAFGTFTDTGEFTIDNLQLDANTISSMNTNGNITIDPNGTGFVNLGADVNIDGNTATLDYDNSGGDIALQFGQTLAKTIKWDNTNTRFTLSDSTRIEGNTAVIGQAYIADDHTAAGSDGTINLGRSGSAWETLNFDIASGQFEFSDDVNISGNLGLGTTTPSFNFHLFDTTSTVAHEWQVFDSGTDQVSILSGTQDPEAVATDADIGSIFLTTSTGKFYIKTDDGSSTNWNESGLTRNLLNALGGTYGTPSLTNKFITDEDPRISAGSGAFGEVALGTHFGYMDNSSPISNSYIFYTRIFLPADTSITSFAIFTTQIKTGDINYGIYSNSSNTPGTKLAEIGVTTSTSPINDFWLLDLSTPLSISTADFYWLAFASSESPKAQQVLGVDDLFIPFRVESKVGSSVVLPATANPNAKGGGYNLPYLIGIE